jgi:hypothetical protein
VTKTSTLLRRLVMSGALALVATACGLSSASDVAATVTLPSGDVVELPRDELTGYYDSVVADEVFASGAFGSPMPEGLEAQMLTEMVLDRVLDDRGIEVSAEQAAQGDQRLVDALVSLYASQGAVDPEADAETTFESMAYIGFLSQLQSKQIALGEMLAADAPEGETVEIPCSSHILLESEEAAIEVIALLEDGADFAETAMEFSVGPTGPTGGDLGCSDPNGFVAEFRDAIVGAPVGTIIGPVQTQFGFHVITINEIQEQQVGAPTAEDLAVSEIVSSLSQIEVEVDPTIGTWDGASSRIIPSAAG